MAIVLGNIALLMYATTPRFAMTERKTKTPVALDLFLSLSRKEHINANTYAVPIVRTKGVESEGEAWIAYMATARGKANSKVNAVDFDSGFSDEENSNGNGFGDARRSGEGGELDWEKQMRKRVNEIEELRELEKKAEELQSRVPESGGEEREETEEEKTKRVRKELQKVAKEQAERRARATLMFELGQKAYEKGMYGRAIEFLEGALTIISKWTLFGGEIQIWLAMAYEARKRHKDCVALYLELENGHPSINIRRQAAELRYISQAPKLKITKEEMVTIPLIGSSYDRYAVTWSDKAKGQGKSRSSVPDLFPASKDYLGDFLVWRSPVGLEKNPTFWVALILWGCLVGAALYLQ